MGLRKQRTIAERVARATTQREQGRMHLNKGIHFKGYITAGDNLFCDPVPDDPEAFIFQVDNLKPFIISPEDDLMLMQLDHLEQMSEAMYHLGECDDDRRRYAKFSKARNNIEAEIERRKPKPIESLRNLHKRLEAEFPHLISKSQTLSNG